MQDMRGRIDAHGGCDCSGCLMGHGAMLLVLLSPRTFSERFGAGARPVHPILRHWSCGAMIGTRGPFQPLPKCSFLSLRFLLLSLGLDMKRRAFLGVHGGAVAWPLAARGQTSAKIPRIGLLWHEAST